MNVTQRVGIIFFMVLAIVAMVSFGGPHGVKPIQVANAQYQDAHCSGCSSDMWCYSCHVMTYQPDPFDPYTCIGCNYYPDGSPVIIGKISKKSFRASLTGAKLLMREGFENIPMRVDHHQKAIEFQKAAPVACRKKLITE